MSKVNKIMEYPFHFIYSLNHLKTMRNFAVTSFGFTANGMYYYVIKDVDNVYRIKSYSMQTSVNYSYLSYNDIPLYIREHEGFEKLVLYKKKLESVLYQELIK